MQNSKQELIAKEIITRLKKMRLNQSCNFSWGDFISESWIRLNSRISNEATPEEIKREITRRWKGLIRESKRKDSFSKRHQSINTIGGAYL